MVSALRELAIQIGQKRCHSLGNWSNNKLPPGAVGLEENDMGWSKGRSCLNRSFGTQTHVQVEKKSVQGLDVGLGLPGMD